MLLAQSHKFFPFDFTLLRIRIQKPEHRSLIVDCLFKIRGRLYLDDFRPGIDQRMGITNVMCLLYDNLIP